MRGSLPVSSDRVHPAGASDLRDCLPGFATIPKIWLGY